MRGMDLNRGEHAFAPSTGRWRPESRSEHICPALSTTVYREPWNFLTFTYLAARTISYPSTVENLHFCASGQTMLQVTRGRGRPGRRQSRSRGPAEHASAERGKIPKRCPQSSQKGCLENQVSKEFTEHDERDAGRDQEWGGRCVASLASARKGRRQSDVKLAVTDIGKGRHDLDRRACGNGCPGSRGMRRVGSGKKESRVGSPRGSAPCPVGRVPGRAGGAHEYLPG
jgi:hypothetical protein